MQFSTVALLAATAASTAFARPHWTPKGHFISVDYYPTSNCSGVHGEAPPQYVPANSTSACVPMADTFNSMLVAGLNGTVLDTCGPFFADAACSLPLNASQAAGSCDRCFASAPANYLKITLKH